MRTLEHTLGHSPSRWGTAHQLAHRYPWVSHCVPAGTGNVGARMHAWTLSSLMLPCVSIPGIAWVHLGDTAHPDEARPINLGGCARAPRVLHWYPLLSGTTLVPTPFGTWPSPPPALRCLASKWLRPSPRVCGCARTEMRRCPSILGARMHAWTLPCLMRPCISILGIAWVHLGTPPFPMRHGPSTLEVARARLGYYTGTHSG